jgi:hypothetical protein
MEQNRNFYYLNALSEEFHPQDAKLRMSIIDSIGYDSLTFESESLTKPTEAEFNTLVDDFNTDVLPYKILRRKRNQLLAESDFMTSSDRPEMSQAWKDYRQALRDLPENETPVLDPDDNWETIKGVTWPEKP